MHSGNWSCPNIECWFKEYTIFYKAAPQPCWMLSLYWFYNQPFTILSSQLPLGDGAHCNFLGTSPLPTFLLPYKDDFVGDDFFFLGYHCNEEPMGLSWDGHTLSQCPPPDFCLWKNFSFLSLPWVPKNTFNQRDLKNTETKEKSQARQNNSLAVEVNNIQFCLKAYR